MTNSSDVTRALACVSNQFSRCEEGIWCAPGATADAGVAAAATAAVRAVRLAHVRHNKYANILASPPAEAAPLLFVWDVAAKSWLASVFVG